MSSMRNHFVELHMHKLFSDSRLHGYWMPSDLWADYCNEKFNLKAEVQALGREVKKLCKDKPGVSAITERNNVVGVDINLHRTEHCCAIDGKRSNVMFFLVTRGCPKCQLCPPTITAVEAWLQSGHVKVRMGKTHVRTADALSEFSIARHPELCKRSACQEALQNSSF